MRKAVLVAAILVIIFLIQPLTQVEEVNANPVPVSWLKINSPVSSMAYDSTSVLLEAVQGNQDVTNPVINMTYSLDHAPYKEVNLTKSEEYHYIDYKVADFTGNVVLDNLTDGNHTITVYSYCKYDGGKSNTVEFFVASLVKDNSADSQIFSQVLVVLTVIVLVSS